MDEGAPARRMRLALDMYEVGEAFVRARLRRETPAITEEALDEAVRAWRLSRPGAEMGDAVGVPSNRFP